jgi:MFS family permease
VRTLVAGFSFVWHHPLILPALALDLFAVLLGGATSLLPIYAKDILGVGPTGLGWLEGAPAAGALLMAVVMAHRPPLKHAGRDLLCAVTGFGLATIVFGFSQNFWLSLAMLFCTGALDNISVIVRHTLVQMLTPDAMRGRVSAVNGMFIGASNELGGFESGMVAAYFTPQFSVVSGGVGTLLVVAVVATVCRQLRHYGRLDVTSAVDEAEAAPRGTHHPAAAAMGLADEEQTPTQSAG